jgi:hypothetical protein
MKKFQAKAVLCKILHKKEILLKLLYTNERQDQTFQYLLCKQV